MLTMARGPTSTLKLDGSGETPRKVVSCCSASSGCSTRSSKRSSKKDLGGRPNSAMEPELSWCRGGAPKRPAGPGQPWLYSGAPEYPGRELEGVETTFSTTIGAFHWNWLGCSFSAVVPPTPPPQRWHPAAKTPHFGSTGGSTRGPTRGP